MDEKNPKRIGPGRPESTGRSNTRPASSKFVQMTSTAFVAVAIGIWFVMSHRFFPRQPGGGFDINRVLAAALVGGIAGGLGAAVGKLIERLRR